MFKIKRFTNDIFTALQEEERKIMFIKLQKIVDCVVFHAAWYSAMKQERSGSILR